MAWQLNTSTWTANHVPLLSDFQAIQTDVQNFGGPVDASGYGLANASSITLIPGVVPGTSYAITAAVWAGGFATFTIGAHNVTVNQLITISGVLPIGYNATSVMVTSVNSTQVGIPMASNPGSFVSGGTLLVGSVPGYGTLAVDQNTVLRIWTGSAWVTGGGPPGAVGGVGATGPSGGPSGPSGPPGSTGPAGVNGAPGGVGATGTPGTVGATGPSGGPTGSTGPSGASGPAGSVGATGAGTVGATGSTGVSGSVGATGAASNAYTTTVSGILTQTINATTHGQGTVPNITAWDTNGNQVQPLINNSGAPSAPTGNITLTFGPNTFTGLIVIAGSGAGVAGTNGIQGATGPSGGPTGPQGSTGPQGIPGTSGTSFGLHDQYFTATLGQTSFTPTAAPVEPCLVFLNGLKQHKAVDYSISGVIIQFVNGLQAGDVVETLQ